MTMSAISTRPFGVASPMHHDVPIARHAPPAPPGVPGILPDPPHAEIDPPGVDETWPSYLETDGAVTFMPQPGLQYPSSSLAPPPDGVPECATGSTPLVYLAQAYRYAILLC